MPSSMELVPTLQYSTCESSVLSADCECNNGIKCSILSMANAEVDQLQTSNANLNIAMLEDSAHSEKSSFASANCVLDEGLDKGAHVLHKVFDVFDTNKDGKLSYEELNQSMEKLGLSTTGHGQISGVHDAADSNSDGFVDFSEFVTFYHSLCGVTSGGEAIPSQVPAGNVQDLMEAFEVFDKNGDGFISARELQSVLTSLGFPEGRKLIYCENMIKDVDSDGDGLVNLEEFKNMMIGDFAGL